MPPKAGRVIARRYHLEESIGHGAMGIVWRAHDRRLHRKVAIKEVLLDAAIDEHEIENRYQRTQREAEIAARLSHPNIVTVHDVVMDHGRPWIVMELIPSPSLDKIVVSLGPVSALRAARISQQLLAALGAAHAAGVLHRDVKPSNILLAPDRSGDGWGERAVLTDFGIAQFDGHSRLTQTGETFGTPGFMPPERIDGDDATPASDLWSLGATIYAAVQGHGPFDRTTTMSTLSAIMSESPPPAPAAGRLAPLIAGLLKREPDDRLSAPAAARMLAEILPLMAAEAVTPGREDTAPSGLPVPIASPEPLGAPTQTLNSPPRPAPVPHGPPTAASVSVPAPGPPRIAAGPLGRLDWEHGATPPERRARTRRFAAKPMAVIAGFMGAAAVAAAVLVLAHDKQLGETTGPAAANKPVSSPRLTSAAASASGSSSASSAAGPPATVVKAINKHLSTIPASFRAAPKVPPSAVGKTGGFSIDVPHGWQSNSMGQGLYQYTPDNVTYLEIDLAKHTMTNMVSEAKYLSVQERADYPGYRPVYGGSHGAQKPYIQPATILGTAGALWEFDWVSGKGTMRVDILLFSWRQQSYTIKMTSPAGRHDDYWNKQVLGEMVQMLHSFTPLPA